MAGARIIKTLFNTKPDPKIEKNAENLLNNIHNRDIAADCEKIIRQYQNLCNNTNNQPGIWGRRRLKKFYDTIDTMRNQTPAESFQTLFDFYINQSLESSRLAKKIDCYIEQQIGVSVLHHTPANIFYSNALEELNASAQHKRQKIISAARALEKDRKEEGAELTLLNKKNQ